MKKGQVKKLLEMIGQTSVEIMGYPASAKRNLWEVEKVLQEHLVCILEDELGREKERLAIMLNAVETKEDRKEIEDANN